MCRASVLYVTKPGSIPGITNQELPLSIGVSPMLPYVWYKTKQTRRLTSFKELYVSLNFEKCSCPRAKGLKEFQPYKCVAMGSKPWYLTYPEHNTSSSTAWICYPYSLQFLAPQSASSYPSAKCIEAPQKKVWIWQIAELGTTAGEYVCVHHSNPSKFYRHNFQVSTKNVGPIGKMYSQN